jgi:uncharacterized protein (TIGR03083 family)
MDPREHIAALRRDGRRLADAAEGALDRPVPSCPGWTVAELVWHTGTTHDFWRQIAAGEIAGPDDYVQPQRPVDEQLVAWFRPGVEDIATVLERLGPATPVWTWSPRKDVGFICRRMAQETAVHSWDARAAVGRDEPIEPRLAVDGVNEFLDFLLPGRPQHLKGPAETIHLHATDVDGEWLIRAGDGACRVDRSHGHGDAAVRAPTSDLLLLLWRRRSPEALEVHGDGAALQRFLARSDLS